MSTLCTAGDHKIKREGWERRNEWFTRIQLASLQMFICHGEFWGFTCCQRRKIIEYLHFVTVTTEILSPVLDYWKAKALQVATQKMKIGLRLPILTVTNSREQNSHPDEKFLALPETNTSTVVLNRQPFDPIVSQINPIYNLTTLFSSSTI